jgi:hypothetical protein
MLHGLAMSGVSDDPGQTSCVGDDALFRQWRRYLDLVVQRVNFLGDISIPKFHFWDLPDFYEAEEATLQDQQAYQYLKRPLKIGMDGKVHPGFLPTYPNIAEVLMPPDNYHTSSRSGLARRVITFIKQYCRFLNSVELHQEATGTSLFSQDELVATLNPIREVYSLYHIPFEGGPAGYPIYVEREEILSPVIIPPCVPMALDGDWISLFIGIHTGSYMSIPVLVDHSIPSPLCPEMGERWTSTTHRIQRVMVDLGYFESNLIKESIKIGEEHEGAIRAMYQSGYRMIHDYLCIKTVPDWYNEIIVDDFL